MKPHILIVLFILFLLLPSAYAQAWYNTSYAYRKSVNVSNVGLVDWTYNTTVNITFDTASLISANKLNAACGDMRLVYNGAVEIPYIYNDKNYPGNGCNSSSTQLVFKIADNITATSSSVNYYVYYSNPFAANSTILNETVYILYDNFDRPDNNSLGKALTGQNWTTFGDIGSGTVTINSNQIKAQRNVANKIVMPEANLTRVITSPHDFLLLQTRQKMRVDTATAEYWRGALKNGPGYTSMFFQYGGLVSGQLRIQDANNMQLGASATTKYNVTGISGYNQTSNRNAYFLDGQRMTNGTAWYFRSTTTVTNVTYYTTVFTAGTASITGYLDDVAVWFMPLPGTQAFTVGAEESQPVTPVQAPKVVDINLTSTIPSTNCTGNNGTTSCATTTDLSPTFKISLNESVAAGCRMSDADENYTAMASKTNCTLVAADYCSCTWAGTPKVPHTSSLFYFSTISTTGEITRAPIPASNKVNISFTETPVGILRNNQVPADANISNIPSSAINITYNVTNANVSSIIEYFKTNGSGVDYGIILNGTPITGWRNHTYVSNASNTFLFRLIDNMVLAAVYNIAEDIVENILHVARTGSNANAMFLTEFVGMPSAVSAYFFEYMANGTTTNLIEVWYCNSSYPLSGTRVDASGSCVPVCSEAANSAYNHCHSGGVGVNQTCHKACTVPLVNGRVNNIVGPTSTAYFILRCPAGGCTVYSGGSAARGTQTKSTINGGIAWTSETYNILTHPHPLNDTEQINYYGCAQSPLRVLLNCTQVYADPFGIGGIPPSAPSWTSPSSGWYRDAVLLNWTNGASPQGYALVLTNVSLLDENLSFVQKVNDSLGLNTSMVFNTTSIPDGRYYFGARHVDANGLWSGYGYSRNISVDNTPPSITNYSILPPSGSVYNASTTYGLNSSWTDTGVGVDKIWINLSGMIIAGPNVLVGPLAAGNYSYRWYANDSLGNTNFDSQRVFNVSQAVPEVNISVLPGSGSINDTFVFNCSRTYGDVTQMLLVIDGSIVAESNASFFTYSTALVASTHNTRCELLESQNFSAARSNATIVVTKIPSVSIISLSQNPVGVNDSIITTCSASRGDAGAVMNLSRNGTLMQRGTWPLSNISVYPAEASYNLTCTYEESSNYTSSKASVILSVLLEAIVRPNFNASFRANLNNATWVYVKNASGVIVGITNLTSINNPAVGQNATRGLYTVDNGFVPHGSLIYLNVTGRGGPAQIKCGMNNTASQAYNLTSTYRLLTNMSPLSTAQIWCWMDYLKAQDDYNFTIGAETA